MNYSKQYSNVNRSVTQSRDVVKHVLFLYFVRGIKYMQNVVVFHSFRVCGRTIHQSLTLLPLLDQVVCFSLSSVNQALIRIVLPKNNTDGASPVVECAVFR